MKYRIKVEDYFVGSFPCTQNFYREPEAIYAQIFNPVELVAAVGMLLSFHHLPSFTVEVVLGNQ